MLVIIINITTVNWSNKKPQLKFNNSEENHLKMCIQHNEFDNPTSKKRNNEIINDKNIKKVDIKREPKFPIKRPKKEQTNDENKGINKIVKYIFIRIMRFELKTINLKD